MDGSNINSGYGELGSQDLNLQSLDATSSVQDAAEDAARARSHYYKSTIQQSEIEALILLLAAGMPLLSPPKSVATSYDHLGVNEIVATNAKAAVTAMMHAEQVKHDIINAMWDAFLKGVRELSERARKEYVIHWTQEVERSGGPKSSTAYFAYLMSLGAGERDKETNGAHETALSVQFSHTFDHWIIAPLDRGLDATSRHSRDYPSATFIAGALMANADIFHNAIVTTHNSAGFQMNVSPVADVIYAVGPSSGLPGDYQAAAALVAALLNGGAVYKATTDTIEEAAKTGKPPQDLDFAINYAKSILSIVTQTVDYGQAVSKERADQNKMIHLMLAAMALNMLYRATYGGMTGEELASLLKANSEDLPGMLKGTEGKDPEISTLIQQLVSLVNFYLPHGADHRADTIANLMAYIDEKNSVDSMLSTTRMLTSYLATDDLHHKRWEAGYS